MNSSYQIEYVSSDSDVGMLRNNGNMSASQTIVFSALVLLLGLTACVLDPNADFHSQHPDQVLFYRAIFAMQHHRLDVARITLQTLVNTYPNSGYASKADRALENPLLEECSGAGDMQFFNGSSPCEGKDTTVAPLQELEFFPAPKSEQPSPHP
jgi:hypothetical protein